MEQLAKQIGVYNSSYKECWAQIGLRFRQGLADNLTGSMAVKLEGAKGAEWTEISAEEFEGVEDWNVVIEGGADSELRKQRNSQLRVEGLKLVQTVNPKWKDAEILRASGYSDEDVMNAFSLQDPDTKELLSEASMAESLIVEGKVPEINTGATVAFMQHIIDFSNNLTMKDVKKQIEIQIKLNEYAMKHGIIVIENERRKADVVIQSMKAQQAQLGQTQPSPQPQPQTDVPSPDAMIDNPTGEAISAGQNISNQLRI